ncbi:hypothetical protein [Tianweitania sp.]|uniref:hypothetical protein n=1 Tax=Tianweitania sp. TaxID=2021634 RepID=UPI00289E1B72|nr:hypothetical protein [Tianweitania sp.]
MLVRDRYQHAAIVMRLPQTGVPISKKRTVFVSAALVLVAACAAIWFVMDRGLSEIERSVRRSVEDKLAQSYDVSTVVEGEAGIDLFPRLALVFSNVLIKVPGTERRSLQIDRIEVPVSFASLWQRSLTIETIVLVRPLVEVGQRNVPVAGASREPDRRSPPRPDRNTAVRSDFIHISENIGRVQIVDGAFRHGDASPAVSEANGTLILAPNAASASFEGTAVLNGDEAAISLSLDDPAGFAKGTETNLRASASSETLTIKFDGKGSLRPGLYMDGAFEGSLARPQQVLDVFSGRQTNPARIPSITVRTRLVVDPD